MTLIPLQVLKLEKEGYHILVEVEVLGSLQRMVVDTGASKTVLDRDTLVQHGVSESEFINSDLLSSGLGTNEMKSETYTLHNFKIGQWESSIIEVAILDLSSINFAYKQMNLAPIVGVLGGDILLNYGAVINYKQKTLRLNNRKIRSS